MRLAVLLAAGAALSAAPDPRALARALAGRVPGAAVTCIPTRADTPIPIGDRILLYRDGRRIWRNDLPAACPGLDDDPIIVTEIHGGQLCRDDQFYTVRRAGASIPGPRCRLGSFVPYEKAKR